MLTADITHHFHSDYRIETCHHSYNNTSPTCVKPSPHLAVNLSPFYNPIKKDRATNGFPAYNPINKDRKRLQTHLNYATPAYNRAKALSR